MRIPAAQMREKVTMRPVKNTPDGQVPGDPTTVRAGVKFASRVIRAPGGEEIVVQATVKLDPENAPALESQMTVGVGTPYAREGKVERATLIAKPRQAAYVEVLVS